MFPTFTEPDRSLVTVRMGHAQSHPDERDRRTRRYSRLTNSPVTSSAAAARAAVPRQSTSMNPQRDRLGVR